MQGHTRKCELNWRFSRGMTSGWNTACAACRNSWQRGDVYHSSNMSPGSLSDQFLNKLSLQNNCFYVQRWLILCVLLTLTLFQKLCHTLNTSCRQSREEEKGEGTAKRRWRGGGQEASSPKENGASVKKKIFRSTRDKIGYSNQNCLWYRVHSLNHSLCCRDVWEAAVWHVWQLYTTGV